MPRQRPLKPEFFLDKTIGRLGSQIATVYLALPRWADDGGVVRIEPDLLKGQAFIRWPEMTTVVLTEALMRLHAVHKIEPYAIGDELYALLPDFEKPGTINNPSQFRYPRGGQPVTDIRAWVNGQLSLSATVGLHEGSHSPQPPCPLPLPVPKDSLSSPSSPSETEKVEKPKGEKRSRRTKDDPPPDAQFETAWTEYPDRGIHKHSKRAARRQWDARKAEGCDPADMIAGTVGYKGSIRGEKIRTEFVKMAATFYGRDRHWEEFVAQGRRILANRARAAAPPPPAAPEPEPPTDPAVVAKAIADMKTAAGAVPAKCTTCTWTGAAPLTANCPKCHGFLEKARAA